MFERFTEKGIKVIMLAQEEARRLKHSFVGSEYVLLGLIGEGTGIAAKALKAFNVNLKDARIEVEKLVGRGDGSIAVEIPFTSDGKRQLEYAWDEARGLGHNYVGTEHLLLGLLRLEGGDGLKTLENLGVDSTKLREKVIALLGERAVKNAYSSQAIEPDPVDDEINKVLFEAVVGALPVKARPIILELRATICAKEKAFQSGDGRAESLHSHESKLLAKLWELTSQPPELGKVTFELREIRWQKEVAIKAQEFEKAASLREKETELSEKLRELEGNKEN